MRLKGFVRQLEVLTPGLLNLPVVKKRQVTKIHLGCYSPGGSRRYQIEFLNDKGQEVFSIPQYHIEGKDFVWLLQGISETLFYMKGE